ncbi:hypothetical protein ACP4OV_009407 [Aristida adscensionis]
MATAGPLETAKAKPAPSLARSFASVFAHADAADVALMVLGLVGAIGDGMSTPLLVLLLRGIFNGIGAGPDHQHQFLSRINEKSRSILFLALGSGFAAFLGVLLDSDGGAAGVTDAGTVPQGGAPAGRGVLRPQGGLDVGGDHQRLQRQPRRAGRAEREAAQLRGERHRLRGRLRRRVRAVVAAGAGDAAVRAAPRRPRLLYSRILVGLARQIREQYTRPGAIAEQAISSVRTVYSFVAERSTMARFSAALDESTRLGLKQGLAKGIAVGSSGVCFAIHGFNAWYGSRLVMYHGYKGGTVFAVGASIVLGGTALGSSLSSVKYFSEASSAAERILEAIQRVPKIDSESNTGRELANVVGEVEFKNVEFCYPSRPESPVFVSFNLRVPAGRTVALVGSSGSGKSTVIALLERFYDPSAGQVMLDGVDIRLLRLKWLRTQMGLVSQEPMLFAMSIKKNILFGKENATEEEVITAAKAANAHSFISQLPQGYDTQVGERGIQMSGGQKQRIAIARALLKSPKILLLDEATSALDTNSESVVQEALDRASIGRTTIVIAHRLSSIRNADMIAVMQAREIKELGSHEELIANENGLYSSLLRLQQTKKSRDSEELGETGSASVVRRSKSNSMSMSFSVPSKSTLVWSRGDEEIDNSMEEPKLLVPSFKRLLLLNAPEWKYALLGSFGAIVFGGIQPAYAYTMGSMITNYFSTNHEEMKNKTRTYVLIFVALAVLSFFINILQHYNFGVMGEYLTKRIREQMLAKILSFEIGWFDRDENSSGAICSQLAKDANVVRSLVGDRLSLVIQTVSAVLIACIMGLVIAWRLALVMIAVQPLIIMCFYARRVLLKGMSDKSLQAQSECSKLAAEAVSNIRTITVFSSQDRILRLFEQAQDGPRKESIRQSWFAGLGLGTSMCLLRCTMALDFWYGGILMAENHITAKALIQTFMVLVSTGRVIADAGSMTTDLARGSNSVASVFAVLDQETKIDPDNPEAYKSEKLKGEVNIRGVDFAYPSRPDVIIFKGFSLSILPGKSTALVGESGSGKSTIIGLIERFYDPIVGVVEIDGRDIKTYNLRALRQFIGLVSQEPTLFAGTIRENILYGTEKASEDEIQNATRSANAHDFISNLKDGYDTWCGERGVQLSGGQKQRIAIARAILKNPAILLLDEATSALDSESEKVVQEALDRVMVGRTSVVVAHRLSTIQNCDMITVLKKGIVVEKGTHETLMAKGPSGAYFGLVNLQQGGKQH